MRSLHERPLAVAPRAGEELRALAAALTFLTRIPLARRCVIDGEAIARAGAAFPLVGAGIGATVGGIAAVLAQPLSPLLAVALALTAGSVLTGALHLDALADTADGLGGHSREQALAIMREPTLGAYGTIAIALDLLLKAAALTALVSHGHVLGVAVAAGALSRLTPVLLAASLPYANPDGGTGASLTRGGHMRAAVASAVALAVAVAMAKTEGAVFAACTLGTAATLGVAFRRWLGGVTGDTLGAAIEMTEIAVLVVAVALAGPA